MNFYNKLFGRKNTLLKDFDGNNYRTIQIGTQIWIAENLKVKHFRNGEPILKLKKDYFNTLFKAPTNQPAWCYYNTKKSNGKKYGNLYNLPTVIDPRGLAPEGWHVPSAKEWETLINYLGGGIKCLSKMKYTKGWYKWVSSKDFIKNNGPNESGFAALPGGDYSSVFGYNFNCVKESGEWWSSSQKHLDSNYIMYLGVFASVASTGSWKDFHSVRCVRD